VPYSIKLGEQNRLAHLAYITEETSTRHSVERQSLEIASAASFGFTEYTCCKVSTAADDHLGSRGSCVYCQ